MLHPRSFTPARLTAGAAALALCATAGAAQLTLNVTVENLAPSNSISFAPLHLGFNNGSFDALNSGQTPTAQIISVAEGGSGSAWHPAFAATDPGATRGTIAGRLDSGQTRSATFQVDAQANPFFTFASMVVPSNDFFIGNDSPTRYRLFDAAGNLLLSSIEQTAADIWDAGSELFDPAAAAFVGNNNLRTPQNGVVSANFAELAGFDGLPTAAGYVFTSGLAADTNVYRIRFEVVPEPGTYALIAGGLLAVGWSTRRRRPPSSSVVSA